MDKRVIKTKRLICDTFAELLATKNFNDITITDISQKAEVNRKTIYKYYSSTQDILSEIEDKLINSFNVMLGEIDASIELKNPYHFFEALTKVLNENIEFYGKLMKIDANTKLIDKIGFKFLEQLKQEFIKQGIFNNCDVEYISYYVVSGMFGAYQHWFNSGRTIPIETFSKNISRLVYNGMNNFIIPHNKGDQNGTN